MKLSKKDIINIVDNYAHVNPTDFNLPLSIYVDDSKNYKLFNIPIIVFIKNNYSMLSDNYILYDIQNNKLLNSYKKLYVSRNDLFKTIEFIYNNKKYFLELANELIDWNIWYYRCKNYKFSNNINESLLLEMSKIKTVLTGLPMDIWVDTDGSYLKSGHWKRLKFQPNKSTAKTNEFISMELESPHYINNKNHDYSSKDIKMLELFIDENKDQLDLLSDGNISLNNFKNNMVIFDNKGNLKYPEDINYNHIVDLNCNFSLVKKNNNTYNIHTYPKGILYDIWFDYINIDKKYKDNKGEYMKGYIDDKIYKLYFDGRFELIKTDY